MIFIFAIPLSLLINAINCQRVGLASNVNGQRTSAASNCADSLDKSFDCIEKLKISPDAQVLNKKREALFQKCLPDIPAQCLSMKKAGEQCQEQVGKDASVLWTRHEVKLDVSKCFERFLANQTSPQERFSPFGGQDGPPPPPNSMRDPCAPTDNQKKCIRSEIQSDRYANEVASRLKERQRECYARVSIEQCRLDDKQLRDCIERAQQPLMQKAMSKMQECMQTTLGTPIQMPNNFQNSKMNSFGRFLKG